MVLMLWAMVFIAIPIWAQFDTSGWDLAIYRTAMRSLAVGHDPYADGIAKQIAYHSQLALHPGAASDPPYNYVYFPITLPLLRFVGMLPVWFSGTCYWLLYAAGAFAVFWAGMQAVEESERKYLSFFAPVAVFFPALLENGVILSGNIAYIVYGVSLVTAVIGWRQGRWQWFYLAVLVASCFKPPFLTLLAIPVLSARRQWIPAALAATAGVLIFLVQALIWPSLFRHCLQAIALQMGYNRDFGSSLSGTLAGYLLDHGLNYSRGGLIFYLLYATPLCCCLFYISQRYKRGSFPTTRWISVLLPGIILLNPRIQEYDLAVLSIPLALIVWRLFPALQKSRAAIAVALTLFALINYAASTSWILWKNVACCVVLSLFSAGAWQLLHSHKPAV